MTEAANISANIGIVILAAGSSSRLGRPKQLLQYNGESLLQRQVEVATQSNAGVTIVVLGANASLVQKQLAEQKIEVATNEAFAEGIASSIRCGVDALLKSHPSIEGVILMVADQPFVSVSIINDVVSTYLNNGSTIVTCRYDDTFGPPTFFHKSLFSELLELEGVVGARKIIQRHMSAVSFVPFPQGGVDIDTEEDYKKLLDDNKE